MSKDKTPTKMALAMQTPSRPELEGSGGSSLGGRTETVEKMLSTLAAGGEFDALGAIQNPQALSAVLQALVDCSIDEQIELLSLLIVSATHSLLNREIISRHLSFERLLHLEATAKHDIVSRKVFQLIQLLGGHSISVKDLRSLLIAMRSDHPLFNPRRTFQILTALQAMSEHVGPDVFFHFVGSNSGIVLPPMRRWPNQGGFTVNLWFRSDQSDQDNTSIFEFRTAVTGMGYTAKIRSSKLILETLDANGKMVSEHGCSFTFRSQQWYMLTVVYTYSRLRRSNVKCFVDGTLVDSEPFKVYANNVPFNCCCIGSSSSMAADMLFTGDMGAIYLFEKPLTGISVEAICKLGPGYFGNFQDLEGQKTTLNQNELKELQTQRVTNSVIFNYNPMACEGDACLESSPVQSSGITYFANSPHATMLGGVTAIKSQYMQDALRANGGVQVLLPLFSQLKDLDNVDADATELPLTATLLALICSLVCNFATVHQQIEQIRGFLLLGFLLEQSEPRQLGLPVVDIFVETVNTLAVHSPQLTEDLLIKSLCEDILFNWHIWSNAGPRVQRSLLSKISNFFLHANINPRSLPGVHRMLMILRNFPSKVDAKVILDEHDGGAAGVTTSVLGCLGKSFSSGELPPTTAEVEEILYHIRHCHDADADSVCRFLGFLSKLFRDYPVEFLGKSIADKTIGCLVELVITESERISHDTITLIGTALTSCSHLDTLSEESCEDLYHKLAARLEGRLNDALLPSLLSLTTRPTKRIDTSGGGEWIDTVVPEAVAMLVRVCSVELKEDVPTPAALRVTAAVLEAVVPLLSDAAQCCCAVPQFDQLLAGLLNMYKSAMEYGDSLSTSRRTSSVDANDLNAPTERQYDYSSDSDPEIDFEYGSPIDLDDVFEEPPGTPTMMATLAETQAAQVSARRLSRSMSVNSNILRHTSDSSTQQSQSSTNALPERRPRPSFVSPAGLAGMLSPEAYRPGPDGLPTVVGSPNSDQSSDSDSSYVERSSNNFSRLTRAHKSVPIPAFAGRHESDLPTEETTPQPQEETLSASAITTLTGMIVVKCEAAIEYILVHALSEQKDGWVWLRDFDAMVRAKFHSVAASKPQRSYDYIFCQFVIRILSHFHGVLKTFVEDRRSMAVVLGEHGVVTNNLAKYLCYIMQHIVTVGDYFTKMLRFVHQECIPMDSSDGPLQKYSGSESSNLHEKAGSEARFEDVSSFINESEPKKEPAHYKKSLLTISQHLLSFFGVLLSDPRCVDLLDADTKQMMQEEGLWEMVACMVCTSILDPPTYWPDNMIKSPGVRDRVMTESGVKTIEAAIGHTDAPTAVISLVFTMISAASIGVYKQALRLGLSTFDTDLFLGVSALQALVKGPFGELYLQKALRTADGTPLLRPDLPFWQPGGSIAALVMHLASDPWSHTLMVHGKAAVNKLMQRAVQRQANREQLFHGLSAVMQEKEEIASLAQAGANLADPNLSLLEMSRENEAEVRGRQRISAMSMWRRVLAAIANDRGVWAPSASLPGGQHDNSTKPYWRLDDVEDGSRRRGRMVKNETGNSRPDATLEANDDSDREDNQDSTAAVAMRSWSKRVQRSLGLKMPAPPMMDASGLEDLDSSFAELTEEFPRDASALEASLAVDNATAKFAFGEKCILVKPNHRIPGDLSILGNEFFFRVDENSSIYVEAPLPIRAYFDGLNGKWTSAEVAGGLQRRYLLQYTAMEVFLKDRTTLLFAFTKPEHCTAALATLPADPEPQFFFESRLFFSNKRLRRDFILRDGQAKWCDGYMSNFDYLMFLNTMAGRNYCDLGQYPVFPWILSNYTSDTLDLEDPENYRDLSKPIGAQDPDREAERKERYRNWIAEDMGAPPCHYGSHYSTPGFVLFWLIRVEPFTGFFLDLQGGHFDHPDRMFSSLAQSWSNCLQSSTDVKELIPEMFYLHEMFVNENDFDLGKMQGKDTRISDVELPPWADGSVQRFVQLHREALESDYVSANLHLWIDLIFGAKQRGAAAEKATNVFYYLSYEGGVDLNAIDDSTLRAAAEAQISDFGQVPIQIFKQPHPPRKSAPPQARVTGLVRRGSYSARDRAAFAAAAADGEEPQGPVIGIDSKGDPVVGIEISPESPVTFICGRGEEVITISCNQCIWNHRHIGGRFVANSSISNPNEAAKRRLGEPFDQRTTISPALFDMTTDHKVALACGYWDGSLKCFSSDGKFLQNVYAHSSILTCVAASPTGGVFATGSRDSTVTIWRYSSPFRVHKHPHAVLVGHEHPVVCVAIDSRLDTVLSASLDLVLLHKLNGDLVRVLQHPSAKRPQIVRLTSDGNIVVFYRDKSSPTLAVFNINGALLASLEVDEHLIDMRITSDGRAMVTGGLGRKAVIWKVCSLGLVATLETGGASIRSVGFTGDEQTVIIGLATGKVSCRRVPWEKFGDPIVFRQHTQQGTRTPISRRSQLSGTASQLRSRSVSTPVRSIPPKIVVESPLSHVVDTPQVFNPGHLRSSSPLPSIKHLASMSVDAQIFKQIADVDPTDMSESSPTASPISAHIENSSNI